MVGGQEGNCVWALWQHDFVAGVSGHAITGHSVRMLNNSIAIPIATALLMFDTDVRTLFSVEKITPAALHFPSAAAASSIGVGS